MAIESSLIYLYRVLWWSRFCFYLYFFYYYFYRRFTEYAPANRLSWVSHWLFIYHPPPHPQKITLFRISLIFLRMSVWNQREYYTELGSCGGLPWFFFFWLPWEKFPGRHHEALWRIKFHDWQSLLRPTSSRISSHLATQVEDWFLAWDGKIGYCKHCCWL